MVFQYLQIWVYVSIVSTSDKKNTVVKFERSLGSKFDIKLKRFCKRIHKKDFDRFEEYQKGDLLEAHHLRIKYAFSLMND